MSDCIYKTTDGYCELHSDGIEYREPCVEGPCDDRNRGGQQMTGGQLFLLGYFLGAILSLVVYSALVASEDPPKPHTTLQGLRT